MVPWDRTGGALAPVGKLPAGLIVIAQWSLSLRRALVERIVDLAADRTVLEVSVDGVAARAIAYPGFTGPLAPGDEVIVNTTAVELGLGSGGVHFVLQGPRLPPGRGSGHLMKLRYTPLQICWDGPEDPDHPQHGRVETLDGLGGAPVVILALHSQLMAAVATAHRLSPGVRVVYVMTDGGALPVALSDSVRALRERGLLAATVSVGEAFGGDLEAVNLYSGLLLARWLAGGDLIVVGVGPGVVGTGTPLGHSGVKVGEAVNAVAALGGRAVVAPRIMVRDPRRRHQGVSHHTLAALGRVALAPAEVAVPLDPDADRWVEAIRGAGGAVTHRIRVLDGEVAIAALEEQNLEPRVMGRSVQEEPAFFRAVGAAVRCALGPGDGGEPGGDVPDPAADHDDPELHPSDAHGDAPFGDQPMAEGERACFEERRVEHRRVYAGRRIALWVDTVEIPGGGSATRDVVVHPGAVAVVARTARGVILVRQFRHAPAEMLWEVPAGGLSPGEDPFAAARRELEEETGYRAARWRDLGYGFTTPGFTDERMYFYLAEDLRPGPTRWDADERLEVREIPWEDAVAAARAGRLHDMKTVYALLRADGS